MKFPAVCKKSRSDLSGRESFNLHVDWCLRIAVAVCVTITLKTGLLQFTDLYGTKAKGTKQKHLREQLLLPVRGEIVDRNGVLLATSLQFQTVAMDPFKVRSVSHTRRLREFAALESVLGVSVSELEILSSRNLAMVPVERAVAGETAARLKEYLKKGALPGIELVYEQVREYPWGDYTKAILGVVRGSRDILLAQKNAREHFSPHWLTDHFPWYLYSSISGATPQRGIGGIEQVFDSWLAGTADHYVHHLDRNMIVVQGFTKKVAEGESPCSVVLTIDIGLQRFIARLIQKKVAETDALLGMAVVMDAHSGEALAAYSASRHQGQMISDDNRVFTSSFEPGSVAKPLMMLYALELGVVSENDRFDCNLPARVGNKIYRDERRYTHHLSPREVLAVSSDAGMAQIVSRIISNKGGRLSTDTVSFLRRCGLGESMSINHTAICRSTLPSPEQWTSITGSQLAIGYELKVSPFHLVSAYAGLVNGGKLVKPMLVRKIVDQDGLTVRKFSQKRPLQECFTPRYATIVYDYLKAVVSMKGGTGRRAAIKGIEIAGKTGTSRRLVNGKYSWKSHNATFVGILPVEDSPPLIIGVFLHEVKRGSDYAGVVCAPVFREIAKYLIENGPGLKAKQSKKSNALLTPF